jgi:hypothetical protein
MTDKQTGGPAFPVDTYDTELNKIIQSHGMTLRDYFAAKALQGLLANPDTAGDLKEFPRWAYTYADIMLRAREVNND